jgi:hypothetical protein
VATADPRLLTLASPGGLRALQNLAGNAAIQRLIVQRQDEATGGDTAGDASVPGPQVFSAVFVPDDIVAAMAGMGEGAGDLAPDQDQQGDDSDATAQALFVQRDPPPPGGPGLPAAAAPPKAGSATDVLSALAAVPEFKAALEALKRKMLADWEAFQNGTTTGEKVVPFSVAGLIVAGAVAGIASNPQSRKAGIDLFNGVKIPVPIPALNGALTITPMTSKGAVTGGIVGLDLCKIPGVASSPVCR